MFHHFSCTEVEEPVRHLHLHPSVHNWPAHRLEQASEVTFTPRDNLAFLISLIPGLRQEGNSTQMDSECENKPVTDSILFYFLFFLVRNCVFVNINNNSAAVLAGTLNWCPFFFFILLKKKNVINDGLLFERKSW